MAGNMDLAVLRELLSGVVMSLVDDYTHRTLAEACERLGLPTPPDDGTKRERVSMSWAAVSDAELPKVAKNILKHQPLDPETRNAIQDTLWADEGSVSLP